MKDGHERDGSRFLHCLTWCFDDEATQETDKLFACVRDDGAVYWGYGTWS